MSIETHENVEMLNRNTSINQAAKVALVFMPKIYMKKIKLDICR